jgi:hypothetical protein
MKLLAPDQSVESERVEQEELAGEIDEAVFIILNHEISNLEFTASSEGI